MREVCYAPPMLRVIGQNLPRADGVAKVTGSARYVDDIRPEGCLYGATVRSARAHARVTAVTRDPQFDWSGVTLLTAADLPGINVIHLMTNDQPALADGLVRHATEAIALVAADSRDRALAAARHVRVTYEDLPPVFDLETAEGSDTVIYSSEGEANNVFSRVEVHREPEAPIDKRGLRVIEGTYRVGLQEQLYIEPQGMLAVPREDGGITIIGSMQCPFYIFKALQHMLGHDRINVVQAATGGGFGGKEEYPSMLAAHATALALRTGKPVKMVYRRDEDLRATTKRHPAVVRLRSAVTPEGILRRWDAHVIVDGGAYNTLTPVVLSRAVLHLSGPYRCDEVHLRGVAVATHTPPNGAFRGFGAPQAFFGVERHMDRIARELGLDPAEVRRRNLVTDGDLSCTGQVLAGTAGFPVLEAALQAARPEIPPASPPPGGSGAGWKRGRGMALVFHGCGFTGNGEAWLKGRVGMVLRGDRVRVLSGSTDIGQASETTFIQIAAEELGIDPSRVTLDERDTDRVPDSGPTVASRTCMVVGGCVQKAARMLRDAVSAETGGGADATFDDLLAARTSDAELAVEYQYTDDGSLTWDGDNYRGDAYPTYGWSCAVVDLDVDTDTGEVLYRRFVSATDVGKAINPAVVAGQIEGGSIQALGYATAEEVVLDDQRCMRNDRMTNYIIPTAADAPEMVTVLVEVPYVGGPFGAKGVGEIPMDGPAAAVAQAIEQATGAVLDQLPMTPERVLAALEGRA